MTIMMMIMMMMMDDDDEEDDIDLSTIIFIALFRDSSDPTVIFFHGSTILHHRMFVSTETNRSFYNHTDKIVSLKSHSIVT